MNLRNYIVCFIALPLVAGCVKPGHIKFREAPKYNIIEIGSYELAIDKMFALSGDLKSKFKQPTMSGYRKGDILKTRYLFLDTSNGTDTIHKAIMLIDYQIKDPQMGYRSEAHFDTYSGKYIDRGTTEVNGIRCAYLIRAISRVNRDVLELATAHGYHIDQNMGYGIEIRIAKTIGRSRMIHILYAEGGTNNYDGNYSAAFKTLEKFKAYIMFSK